jgi:hypothetical protein
MSDFLDRASTSFIDVIEKQRVRTQLKFLQQSVDPQLITDSVVNHIPKMMETESTEDNPVRETLQPLMGAILLPLVKSAIRADFVTKELGETLLQDAKLRNVICWFMLIGMHLQELVGSGALEVSTTKEDISDKEFEDILEMEYWVQLLNLAKEYGIEIDSQLSEENIQKLLTILEEKNLLEIKKK